MELNPRQTVLKMLRTAVANATLGEIHRAADFLVEARKIRLGKRKFRSAKRRTKFEPEVTLRDL